MGAVRLKEGEQNYTYMLFVSGLALVLAGGSDYGNGWLLLWCGLGFLIVALGYSGFGPRVFGKRADGDRSWLNRTILFPFLALNAAMWHLRHRLLSKEDICNEVAPGLWLGRRPIEGELPAEVRVVVDLTAEFSATPSARKLTYFCLPTLDGLAPDFDAFIELMGELQLLQEPLYIHCAAGHGRSAMVAAAVLIARGLADDVDSAEAVLKAKRPKVSIKKPQREMLSKWIAHNNKIS